MSKHETLLEYFESGESLTAKQIAKRLNTKYPHSLIRDLRVKGYTIYRNPRFNSKGQKKFFYRLGTPTRAVIARYHRFFGPDY